MPSRTLIPALRINRTVVLAAVAAAQLALLLTMPATLYALKLLGRAVTHGYAGYALLAPVLLAAGILFNKYVRALDWRWLEWSPWGIRANLALAPIKLRYLWLPYALALSCCIPLLAFFEEEIFRNGTHTLLRGLLWGGLAFGVVHLISCVTVRMSIYLSLVGLALVGIYMEGGLIAVFVTHASYNLLALTLVSTEQHLPRKPRNWLAQALPALGRGRGGELAAAAAVAEPVTLEPVTLEPVTQPQAGVAEIDGIDFTLVGEVAPDPPDTASLREAWPQHPRPTRQSGSGAGDQSRELAGERRRGDEHARR